MKISQQQKTEQNYESYGQDEQDGYDAYRRACKAPLQVYNATIKAIYDKYGTDNQSNEVKLAIHNANQTYQIEVMKF